MEKRWFLLVVVLVFFSIQGIYAMADEAALVEYMRKDDRAEVAERIEKGLDLNCRLQSERTMLHIAVLHNAPQTAELLLDRGTDPNLADENGIYPLHTLVLTYDESRDAIANLLVDCERVESDPKDKHGNTPLHFAVTSNHYSMVARLVKKGADPDICDNDGENAFDKARGVSTMLGLLYQEKK